MIECSPIRNVLFLFSPKVPKLSVDPLPSQAAPAGHTPLTNLS